LKTYLLAICFFSASMLTATSAHALAHCFCKITTGNSSGSASPVGVELKSYPNMGSWNTQIGSEKEQICRNNCQRAVETDPQKFDILKKAATHVSAGVVISAYHKIGSKKYQHAANVGRVPTSDSPAIKP
jgi:hypothetical protein